jgi:hypothetical protein
MVQPCCCHKSACPGACHEPARPGACHEPARPGACHEPARPGACHEPTRRGATCFVLTDRPGCRARPRFTDRHGKLAGVRTTVRGPRPCWGVAGALGGNATHIPLAPPAPPSPDTHTGAAHLRRPGGGWRDGGLPQVVRDRRAPGDGWRDRRSPRVVRDHGAPGGGRRDGGVTARGGGPQRPGGEPAGRGLPRVVR